MYVFKINTIVEVFINTACISVTLKN